MSLFPEYNQVFDVYLADDSSTTKITTYDLDTADFSVTGHMIRISSQDEMIEGEALGTHRMNLSDSNGSLAKEGSVFVSRTTNIAYKVVNRPRYNKLFKRYKLHFKPTKNY